LNEKGDKNMGFLILNIVAEEIVLETNEKKLKNDLDTNLVQGIDPLLVKLALILRDKGLKMNSAFSIFDIDGVLCKDPEYGVDLDEEKYVEHIRTVQALIPLQFPVKAICTHRLGKYYEPTREWLSKNGIGYNMIYMLDYPTIEDKIKNANNPVYINMKSNVYNLYPDAILFVESNYNEAMEIYQNTHRPVLCTDANIILQD
jgi:uncharacterized HAD superfamily protein